MPEAAPEIRLPPLPTAADARADPLERVATSIVQQIGPVSAAALAAAIDEAVEDARP